MDKEQYIKNLQDVLKENFSQQQANDILADYSEFFDAGIAEGKSESELCAEFGNPEKVAVELLGSNLTEQTAQTNRICPKLTSAGQKLQAKWLWLKITLILGITISFLQLTYNPWNLGLYGRYFTLLLPLALQAVICMSNPSKVSTATFNTTRLCRIRQNWLSGWKMVVILLFLSIVLGCFIVRINHPIWQNPHLFEHIFIYTPALVLMTIIGILYFIYPPKPTKYRYLKVIFIVSYSLIASFVFALFIILLKLAPLNPFDRNLFKLIDQLYNCMTILCCGIVALSVFTAILVTSYAIHENANAKWLLFLSTTCFTIFLNGMYILFNFTDGSTPNLPIFLHSIRNSILLNAVSAALFILFLFIQRKLKAKRGNCFERANEKGNS